jgi:hypothetical protein
MTRQEIIAYAAGMFDGEGCITFSKRLRPRVKITSCDKELVVFFKDNFGGSLEFINNSGKNPNWRSYYNWILQDTEVIPFLDKIYNFLHHKKKKMRAKLLLENYVKLPPGGHPTCLKNINQRKKRNFIRDQFTKMSMRGTNV